MNNQIITIRFEGGKAEYHELDLRKLCRSLTGVEKIITNGLSTVLEGRALKRGERPPLVVRASMPRCGSFEIEVFFSHGVGILPLLHEAFTTGISEIIWRLISGVMFKMAGREGDAESHFAKLYELLDAIDARRHKEVLEWQKLLSPAQEVVSPIGDSCDCMIIQGTEKTEIDFTMAEAIRSKNRQRVGDDEVFRIRILAFNHSNRRLKVSLHDESDIISAKVRDPAFDYNPNIYTSAAINKGWINVKAKAARLKDGQIKELYIIEAWPVDGS